MKLNNISKIAGTNISKIKGIKVRQEIPILHYEEVLPEEEIVIIPPSEYSITAYPTGYGCHDGINFSTESIIFGTDGLGNYYQNWIQFSLLIQKGAIIDSAIITIVSGDDNMYPDVGTLLSGNTAPLPTSIDEYNTLNTTINVNVWLVPTIWTTDILYQITNISNIVQEIIDNPEWVYGNYFTLLIKSITPHGYENIKQVNPEKIQLDVSFKVYND